MRRISIVVLAALLAAACTSSDVDDGERSAPDQTTTEPEFAGTIDLTVETPDRCEVVGHECALPFPSDALTVEDPEAETGRRVALDPQSLPANADGVHIDTARQNRNDGFSPGSAALVLLPGLDPDASMLPPVTDIGRSLDDDSGSVIVDATTGERWLHWAELDANAPTDAFRAYRDRLESNVPEVEARRPAMERVFADLEAAGVARDELTIAWEFTVISTESLAGPLLHMRDDAFETLGQAAPSFTVDAVVPDPEQGRTVIAGTSRSPST